MVLSMNGTTKVTRTISHNVYIYIYIGNITLSNVILRGKYALMAAESKLNILNSPRTGSTYIIYSIHVVLQYAYTRYTYT